MELFFEELKWFKEAIVKKFWKDVKIYWIPKNWMIISLMLWWMDIITDERDITLDTLIIDDIIDSGKTFSKYPNNRKAALYWKSHSPEIDYVHIKKDWRIGIPFEKEKPVEENITRLLEWIWENPNREWLLSTPKRVIKMYGEIFRGYNQETKDIMTVFENESDSIDQIVWLNDIEYYSFCEHHMLPFFWKAHIYYIPGKHICGISKLARILDIYSRRLQNQERLAKQVADDIEKYLEPKWVAVILEAQHFCMMCRWVSKQNAVMKTSDIRWAFKQDEKARQEVFNLIQWK